MTVREISSLEELDLDGHFVIVEESPIYPGQLVLVADDQDRFRSLFRDFVSRYHILKELSLYDEFLKEASRQGYNVFVMPSGVRVVDQDAGHRAPLYVEGFALPDGGQLFQYQQYGLSKALGLDYMFFNWGTGSGKGHTLSTNVPTPQGWRKWGDLRVGDQVFGSDGSPTIVTHVHHRGVLPTYLVTFSDHSSVEVDGDHIWSVWDTSIRNEQVRFYKVLQNKTTTELAREGLKKEGRREYRWRIPLGAALYGGQRLPIGPYTLGSLIANGHLSGSGTILTTPDEAVISRVREEGYVVNLVHNSDPHPHNCPHYSLPGLRQNIRDLRLDVLSGQKFIPEQYLLCGYEQRIALLQGLMDGDGSSRAGGRRVVNYHTTSSRLADDVRSLVNSLGGTATTWTTNRIGHSGNTCQETTLNIMLPASISAWSSDRKTRSEAPTKNTVPKRSIVSIEPVGEQEIRCITVAASNSLYMVGDGYIITHNSVAAAAGAQELILNRREFDLALVFALKKIKGGLARTISTTTQLRVRIIDGSPQYRTREYAKADADVYVLNYEKAHYDQRDLTKLMKGKRVLFIFDEVQRILVWNGGRASLAAKSINALVRKPKKKAVWPMSASIINQNPARYWRVFQWAPEQPLGLLGEFRKKYQTSGSALWFGEGARSYQKDTWNEKALEEVRHRVAHLTHAVRKTDPGVREMFKGIQWIPVEVEMSPTDREIYEVFREEAIKCRENNEWDRAAALVSVMKLVCNTSEALFHTSHAVVAPLMRRIDGKNLKTSLSAKWEMVLDKILEIQGQGDKVVLFTQYTNLGLFLLANELKKKGIGHVLHWGDGMSYKKSLEMQDTFNRDPSITVFASSNAGTYGLNLQGARYVINYEIPMSYDDLMQRNSRIDRADSHLDGLTCYGYYCKDTVEERSFDVMEQRRELAEIIQGTREQLSRARIEVAGLDNIGQRREVDYMLGRD